jgi:uncharacterized membrane protein
MNPYQQRAKRPASALAGPYGHPFHAMLVPLPIGAFVGVLALDIASRASDDGRGYFRAATIVLGLGLLGALCAALFGFMDYGQLQRGTRANRTATVHMIGNLVVVGLLGFSFLARLGSQRLETPGALLALTIVALALLSVTGWLGGKMTYEYGVRVADEQTQADAFGDDRGLLPPVDSGLGRVDRIPGTNVPVGEARS